MACHFRDLPDFQSSDARLMTALAVHKLTEYCVQWSVYCPQTYGTAKKKRPGYLVGNLVATNWPIEKALHAIGYNQIPTK